jgi:predicted AlkP superfamily pyrophosphatase or phosphodiesterase
MVNKNKKLLLLEVPGFSRHLLDHAPKLRARMEAQSWGRFDPVFPALTLPSHVSLLNGCSPAEHGLLANGFHDRDLNQTFMWPQSEALVRGEPIWESLKKERADFKCLKYFWWPGMASSADVHGNVRPVYHADGRKSPGLYMNREGLADALQAEFGEFPLFRFWGPATDISSSQWILDTASALLRREHFDLGLIYVPHLDYRQQTLGPKHPSIATEVHLLDEALEHFFAGIEEDYSFALVSSYGITEVSRDIAINRHLRERGWLKVVHNLAGERVDTAMSEAFAIADHQVALVYVKDPQNLAQIEDAIAQIDGVESVLRQRRNRDRRCPDLLCVADTESWFSYAYWLDEGGAPDFAHSVAIHDKMGYDPCEMLFDSKLRFPKLKMVQKLLQKKCGFRTVMDVISTEPWRIKGSHGRLPDSESEAPIWMAPPNFHGSTRLGLEGFHRALGKFFR